jgi:hypothetical protein
MNQRGEATLLCILVLVVLSGLVTLCGLRLQHSFSNMKKRTELFLCVKETKGELHRYLKFMGRTNWALKNTTRAQMVALFIPGLQGAAFKADKIKRILKASQNVSLIFYYTKLAELKNKGCPLDPRMALTPFELSGTVYKRGPDDRALIRSEKWTYLYLSKPYLISLEVQTAGMEAIYPRIKYIAEEKGAKLSSLLSLRQVPRAYYSWDFFY